MFKSILSLQNLGAYFRSFRAKSRRRPVGTKIQWRHRICFPLPHSGKVPQITTGNAQATPISDAPSCKGRIQTISGGYDDGICLCGNTNVPKQTSTSCKSSMQRVCGIQLSLPFFAIRAPSHHPRSSDIAVSYFTDAQLDSFKSPAAEQSRVDTACSYTWLGCRKLSHNIL